MSNAEFVLSLAVVVTCCLLCLWVQSRRIDKLEDGWTILATEYNRLADHHNDLIVAHNTHVAQTRNRERDWTEDGEGWRKGVPPDEEYMDDK